MTDFLLDNSNRFIISDFQQKRPFTNLLPGIAGPLGLPLWIFYVNRGQGITSFGVQDKDHPIMEFQPANKAYQVTPSLGFRTFIKFEGEAQPEIYEPFSDVMQPGEQKLIISLNELMLQEKSKKHDLEVEVLYFGLSGEKIAGLIRQVKLINFAQKPVTFEIIDGLPVILPYGVSDQTLKENSRTIEAWMEVQNQEAGIPFYNLRSTLGDTAEVKPIKEGNFAHAFAFQKGVSSKLVSIVDPEKIFGYDSSLKYPVNFQRNNIMTLGQPSYSEGKTPCAFFGKKCILEPQEELTIYGIYGFASRLELLSEYKNKFNSPAFFTQKRQEANLLIQEITTPIFTETKSQLFDAYCKQTYLDNILRGGWPVYLGNTENPIPYHIYFRKHGDPERDYNAFYLAPEFYSQGNGNFRDINQNRRNEVWFHPKVGNVNVKSFMSLIQADGYNPLNVKGNRYLIDHEKQKAVLDLVLDPEKLEPFLQNAFTPGGLLKELDQKGIKTTLSALDFLNEAILAADQYFDAEYGEGYWTDHWTYNLDLIESYLEIFPDKTTELLLDQIDIPFFDSSIYVLPRDNKYVLAEGHPRQYKALSRDKTKTDLISKRRKYANLMRIDKGHGEIYRTSIIGKLILLGIIKFSTLDPLGLGVEMEAGRPGWCDALNGLPGLFGSSMSETFELTRLISFLLDHFPDSGSIALPIELVELIQNVENSISIYEDSNKEDRNFIFWNDMSEAREIYREKIRFGFDGKEISLSYENLSRIFKLMQRKVKDGIDRAIQLNNGSIPTYFTHEVDQYIILKGKNGIPLKDEKGHKLIRVLSFKTKVLPLFLEGIVRYFKILPDIDAARALYNQVKTSPLYDQFLKMYKTNASLHEQSMEIGRLRVFTPGWLENESIFLHMEYKYLLEILKAGLYDEFFEDFRNAIVAFQEPGRYGRSPLENSSFIVSSSHPDKNLHGTGFVARLTGATAEFLSMWSYMMLGERPFRMQDDGLSLILKPVLPGWLFDDNGCISFNFLGHCKFTLWNLKPPRASKPSKA